MLLAVVLQISLEWISLAQLFSVMCWNKCEIKVGQTALSEKVFYHWWDSEADAEANADVEADEANSTTPCIMCQEIPAVKKTLFPESSLPDFNFTHISNHHIKSVEPINDIQSSLICKCFSFYALLRRNKNLANLFNQALIAGNLLVGLCYV